MEYMVDMIIIGALISSPGSDTMYELIKTNLSAYILITAFMGWWILSVIYGTLKKAKQIENKKIKNLILIGVSTTLLCFWAYFFVYSRLYPISLAYYEYKNDLVKEEIGVIHDIDPKGKDRVHVVIDDIKYTMVHSSVRPYVNIHKDIAEGDTVKIRYGTKSKFIFDIYKANTVP